MISFTEALHLVEQAAQSIRLEKERVPLRDLPGRICAETIHAPLDIQPFDNSAMDGFAVRLDDLRTASPDNPVLLKEAAIIAAGDTTEMLSLQSGTCMQIMTGALTPEGTEAVVPVEEVIIQGDRIAFSSMPKPGTHIRRRGEDFKQGMPLLKIGEQLTVSHILPLATLGISQVSVFRRPKVLFISTGTELVDDLTASLQPGQIYNSNRAYAETFLKMLGVEWHQTDTIRDDTDSFIKALQPAGTQGYDLIISSGAVSAGAYDFIKEGLTQMGAEHLYHKVKMKPGKPNLLAKLPSGALYFGLPGNPVATAVGLRFFVSAALRVMSQQKLEAPIYAETINTFTKKPGLHMILKGKTGYREDGRIVVDILDGQESFMVRPFLTMNGWVFAEEEKGTIQPGEMVRVYPIFAA